MNRKIKAYVGADMLGVVDRLFQGGILSIISELAQNARRAKANMLDIRIVADPSAPEHASIVEITDNGMGLEDPDVLLGLSSSAWNDRSVYDEDPAGMGFFVLSNSDWAEVRSRGWRIKLTRDSFKGQEVEVIEQAPLLSGMIIRFPYDYSVDDAEGNIRRSCGEFLSLCGMDVSVNGVAVKAADFLARPTSASYMVEHHEDLGVDIMVIDNCGNYYFNPEGANTHLSFNFFGFTGRHELDRAMRSSSIRVNIRHAGVIKPVLPARKELVAGAELTELMNRIERLYYKEVASRKDGHYLPYKDKVRADEIGINIGEAVARLPKVLYERDNGTDWERLGPCTRYAVAPPMGDHGERQTVLMALDADTEAPMLLRRRASMQGYSWYDSIPVVLSARPMLACAALVVDVDDEDDIASGLQLRSWDDVPTTGDISVRLSLRQAGEEDWVETYDAPALLYPHDGCEWCESLPIFIVSSGPAFDVDNVTEAMEHAWMTDDWDGDDDSERWMQIVRATVMERRDPSGTLRYGAAVAKEAAMYSMLYSDDTDGMKAKDTRVVITKGFGHRADVWQVRWETSGKDNGEGEYRIQVNRIVRDMTVVRVPHADNLQRAIEAAVSAIDENVTFTPVSTEIYGVLEGAPASEP